MATTVLGGGCFWCIEAALKGLRGVQDLRPGYAGGHVEHPTYREVCGKRTGHAEVVEVTYDEATIDIATLWHVFFTAHDPTQVDRQGNDVGPQYRSIVFVDGEDEAALLHHVMEEVEGWYGAALATQVEDKNEHPFWPAEIEHHDYFALNPGNPYCAMVVAPKVAKVRQKHAALYG